MHNFNIGAMNMDNVFSGNKQWHIEQGDCLTVLRSMPDKSVQCCVTSPPYWGLRDYGTSQWVGGNQNCEHGVRRWEGDKQTQGAQSSHASKRDRLDRCVCECGAVRIDRQFGLESTPEEYINNMVSIFREVRRVLRDDGTVFLNLGDSYFGSNQTGGTNSKEGSAKRAGRMFSKPANAQRATACGTSGKEPASYPDRDCLCGNLCDACRRAYLIGKSHSDTPHVPMPTVLPSESIPAHKEEQIDHLPTSDSVNQEAHNDPAIPGVENFPNREGELLPASPVSKSDEFSPQSQDKSSGASNQGGVCRLCGRSFSRLVPASVDKSTSPCGNCSTFLSSQHLDSHRHDKVSTADASADHIEGKAYDYSYQYYTTTSHLKPKDLIGIPWRVAFALQADGWYLRSDIIWHKPNPMPESVKDRPTKAHEYIFLLSKSQKYYYDAEAIKEPEVCGRMRGPANHPDTKSTNGNGGLARRKSTGTRNKRTVWTVATKPFKGAHFATFPPELIEPCVLSGCPEGGVVLDPFSGAATTGIVVLKYGRKYVGIELNPEYVEMSKRRIMDDNPLFNGLVDQG